MMRDARSRRHELRESLRSRCLLALGAALAGGCATGVDVSDDELAEICSTPGISCNGNAGASGGSSGGSGSGLAGRGGSNGGTFSSNGGTGTATGGTFSASAGSGGSLSGSSGSGAGGTGSTQPLAEGECLPTNDVVILYTNRKGDASTNEPSMTMRVQNMGASFDLSALTIRYWFTADGTSGFIGTVDYATLTGQGDIKGSITVTFGQESGSDYAQMNFETGVGTVGAEGVRELQLRFHSTPYANMNQTNDFSFIAGATGAATPNPNITPYVNGEQVGGCIPVP